MLAITSCFLCHMCSPYSMINIPPPESPAARASLAQVDVPDVTGLILYNRAASCPFDIHY